MLCLPPNFPEIGPHSPKIKILRGKYRDYNKALKILDQETLETRRKAISLKFAKKNFNHPKMKHLFPISKNKSTRRGPIFIKKLFKKTRAQNGPINYLIRLLNENRNRKKKNWRSLLLIYYYYYCYYHYYYYCASLLPVDYEMVAECYLPLAVASQGATFYHLLLVKINTAIYISILIVHWIQPVDYYL